MLAGTGQVETTVSATKDKRHLQLSDRMRGPTAH